MSAGGIATVWAQKIQEKFTKFTKILNYSKSSSINSPAK